MTWKWVHSVAATVLPWPTRAERRANIIAARKGAEQAERKVAEAENVKHDLEVILRENHFAQTIVDGLISGGRGRGFGS